MPSMVTEQEFLDWEVETRKNFYERAVYYDPRTERAFLLYYNAETEVMASYYVLSEGQTPTGTEILFKYSVEEAGDFQNVTNVLEFKDRANELSQTDDPRMN